MKQSSTILRLLPYQIRRLFCSMENLNIDVASVLFQFCKFGNCLPIFIKLHNVRFGFQFNGILLEEWRIPMW